MENKAKSVYQKAEEGYYKVPDSIPYGTHEYIELAYKLEEEFQNDLASEFGVIGNPKVNMLYWIAYDKGHAYGHTEVWSHYQSLVDLIK